MSFMPGARIGLSKGGFVIAKRRGGGGMGRYTRVMGWRLSPLHAKHRNLLLTLFRTLVVNGTQTSKHLRMVLERFMSRKTRKSKSSNAAPKTGSYWRHFRPYRTKRDNSK